MFLPFMLPLKQYHKATLFFALSLGVVVECPASGSLERGQMENFTGYREGNFVAWFGFHLYLTMPGIHVHINPVSHLSFVYDAIAPLVEWECERVFDLVEFNVVDA